MTHTTRRTQQFALAFALSTALTVACTSDSSVAPLPSVISSPTTKPTPTVPISTTIPATLPLATAPPLTPAVACNFDAIHASTGPPPAGITDVDLRCKGDWASWSGQPDDPTTSDGYFAVAKRSSFNWVTVNFGTAGVCSDGGVPQELWTALNCTE